MIKWIRYIVAVFALVGVIGAIGMDSSFAQADEEEEDGAPRCNCVIENTGGGSVYGRIIGDDCYPNPCWRPL